MSDILEFFSSGDYLEYSGVVDFISNEVIKLSQVKSYFNSTTELGNYTYESYNLYSMFPIYTLNKKYNKSSLKNLKTYYE